MKLWTSLIVGLLFFLPASRAQTQDGGLLPGWRLFCVPIDPRLIDLDSLRPSDGVRPLEGAHPEHQQYDVRDLFKRSGAEIPAGGIAIYQKATSTLLVIAPKETIDLVEMMFQFPGKERHASLRVTATLVEFEAKSFSRIRNLPYARLRSVVENTWKEIEEVTLKADSGAKAIASRGIGDDSSHEPVADVVNRRLPPGRAGTSLEVEAITGPDGVSVDLTYEWHRRSGNGDAKENLDASSHLITSSGVPQIVACWPAGGSAMRCRALVIRTEVIVAYGEVEHGVLEKVLSGLRRSQQSSKTPAR